MGFGKNPVTLPVYIFKCLNIIKYLGPRWSSRCHALPAQQVCRCHLAHGELRTLGSLSPFIFLWWQRNPKLRLEMTSWGRENSWDPACPVLAGGIGKRWPRALACLPTPGALGAMVAAVVSSLPWWGTAPLSVG